MPVIKPVSSKNYFQLNYLVGNSKVNKFGAEIHRNKKLNAPY
jgi:hypothetical protein